jgi:hypothetical protein
MSVLEGKDAAQLGPSDYACHAVWEFAPEDSLHDECWMVPVTQLPVTSLEERCVGTIATLADDTKIWVRICDLCPQNLAGTLRSQYFDFYVANETRSWPQQQGNLGTVDSNELAAWLGKHVANVFPFTYDVSGVVSGDLHATKRTVYRDEEHKKFWITVS